jgi:hypothetical protein
MSLQHHKLTPPTWEELKAASERNASMELRMEIRHRLSVTTPEDEAVLGARDFLEDNDYNFDALRMFIEPELPSNKNLPNRYYFFITRVAASVVLMLFLGYAGNSFREALRHNSMGQIIFREPGIPVFAGINGDRLFYEMMSSFRLEESRQGLRYIDTLLIKYPGNDTLTYYGGWFNYFQRDYNLAAERFLKVANDTGSVYQQKSDLMYAAAQCLDGRRDEALSMLRKIIEEPGHSYAQEARRMMSDRKWWN